MQTALRTGAAVGGSQASIGKWMDAPLQQVPSAASVKQGFISADSKQNSKNEKIHHITFEITNSFVIN